MKIEWDVPITMDDGLVLRADVFRPDAVSKMSLGAQLYLTRALLRNIADRLELANTRITR